MYSYYNDADNRCQLKSGKMEKKLVLYNENNNRYL